MSWWPDQTTLISIVPPDPTTRPSLIPYWYEVVVWTWYLGLLLAQLTNPGAKGGLSWIKYLLVILGILSMIGHAVALFFDQEVSQNQDIAKKLTPFGHSCPVVDLSN